MNVNTRTVAGWITLVGVSAGILACQEKPAAPPKPVPPMLETQDTRPLTPVSATIRGAVNPIGFRTFWYFTWGTTEDMENDTPLVPAGAGDRDISVERNLTGLAPNTVYYYELVATNGVTIAYGGVETFTTPGQAQIAAEPNRFEFQGVAGDNLPPAQTLAIGNSGDGDMSVTVTKNVPWLRVAYTGASTDNLSDLYTVSIGSTTMSPGFYEGEITVTSPEAGNSPVTVPVEYRLLEASPWITTDRDSIFFTVMAGAPSPADEQFVLSNGGGGTLSWGISTAASWLNVSPMSGTGDSATINVSLSNVAGPGVHYADIFISSSNASNSPRVVAVRYTVTEPPPAIALDTDTLYFESVDGAPLPPAKSFGITNSGGGVLHWTAVANGTWFSVTPGSDTGNATTATVTIDRPGLAVGIHEAEITITDPSAVNSPQAVHVVYEIIEASPVVVVSDDLFAFGAFSATPAPADTFRITNEGTGLLHWRISADVWWIGVSQASGTGNNALITLGVETALPPGTHYGFVTVSDESGNSPQQTITVVLWIWPEESSQLMLDSWLVRDATVSSVAIAGWFDNDDALSSIVLPLEVRTVSGDAFAAPPLDITVQGRVGGSPVMGQVVKSFHPDTVANTCSGPESHSFGVEATPRYTSPEAMFWSGTGITGSLAAGIDTFDNPSFIVHLGLNGMPGVFVIDTCCVSPGSHLLTVGSFSDVIPVGFLKGVIVVRPDELVPVVGRGKGMPAAEPAAVRITGERLRR